ncbi:MAG: S41 family peptidase, partial [Tepidisphaeraceae bacterium]
MIRSAWSRSLLAGWVMVAVIGAVQCVRADDAPASAQQVAAVEDLKSEAFKALRSGQFGLTNELLNRAAAMSGDTVLAKMAAWASQFETQRQAFATERRKQYDKAVSEVQLLLRNGKESYAIDKARDAYLLAEDKHKFRAEPWVDDLIRSTTKMATDFEASEQWLKALRLYSDLGSIEPANAEWKDRLKVATRRVRLLALYTPEQLKGVQESEMKEREEVDLLLNPTTKPSTRPAADVNNDTFKVDWNETLRGVEMPMLWDALVDARSNYWRDVNLRDLMLGGLKGVKVLASTKGLEKTFPNLGDDTKRARFLAVVDESLTKVTNSTAGNEQDVARGVLRELKEVNKETIDLNESVLVSEFADGAFSELDPFSSMIWPYDLDEFNKTTQGEFSGVGIQIQSDEDGSLKVVSPLEDSPAYRAGIKAGDVVTHINGKNAKGITLNQAVKNITGPSGTTVILTVRSPDSKVRDYTIRRETIKVASIKGYIHKPGGGWDYFIDPESRIGYLRLTNFTKSTAEELDRAVAEMKSQDCAGLILDLRYNPGGLLTAATE